MTNIEIGYKHDNMWQYGTSEEDEILNEQIQLLRKLKIGLATRINEYLVANRNNLPYGFFYSRKDPQRLCKTNASGVLAFADTIKKGADRSPIVFTVKDSQVWSSCSTITYADAIRTVRPEIVSTADLNKAVGNIQGSDMMHAYAKQIETMKVIEEDNSLF